MDCLLGKFIMLFIFGGVHAEASVLTPRQSFYFLSNTIATVPKAVCSLLNILLFTIEQVPYIDPYLGFVTFILKPISKPGGWPDMITVFVNQEMMLVRVINKIGGSLESRSGGDTRCTTFSPHPLRLNVHPKFSGCA
jgi:hypothetical protein